MSDTAPVIYWIRRDFRLADNPALAAAAATGRPVLPVFILDTLAEARGAAAKWRLDRAIAQIEHRFKTLGSRLILRRGPALGELRSLASESGATAVFWGRDYAPDAVERDTAVKAALKQDGLEAQSFAGMLLWEPWQIRTETGLPYKVYSPFWKKARSQQPADPIAPPKSLRAPSRWPLSAHRGDWALGAAMKRGASVLSDFAQTAGEDAALERMDAFLVGSLPNYTPNRDRLDLAGTSGLSEHLALGEISPRTIWAAARRIAEPGADTEKFLSEIAWRDFAYHLAFHAPKLASENWRTGWNDFPWRGDNADAERWRRGCTGIDVVDAAMREMYVTGVMHNRARMICASYLTKNLLTDWRIGRAWFEDCLVDWDPASNAMGWQWVAGCGPDAAPFFRVFNPDTQAERFDPHGTYRKRWLPQGGDMTHTAAAFYDAVPKSWRLHPNDPAPSPS